MNRQGIMKRIELATISSFSGFHRIIDKNAAAMYRGVSNSSYKLIPKVGRNWKMSRKFLKYTEQSLLKTFKLKARRHLSDQPTSDLEWLGICQHYGALTRLLDWTRNPLVALYFASKGHPNRNGTVYISFGLAKADQTVHKNPFEINGNYMWEPAHITERFSTQAGIFTLSADPRKQLSESVFYKIIVRASRKSEILATLAMYGIHDAGLFPGLDGVARYVNKEINTYIQINDEAEIREVIKKRMDFIKEKYPKDNK